MPNNDFGYPDDHFYETVPLRYLIFPKSGASLFSVFNTVVCKFNLQPAGFKPLTFVVRCNHSTDFATTTALASPHPLTTAVLHLLNRGTTFHAFFTFLFSICLVQICSFCLKTVKTSIY